MISCYSGPDRVPGRRDLRLERPLLPASALVSRLKSSRRDPGTSPWAKAIDASPPQIKSAEQLTTSLSFLIRPNFPPQEPLLPLVAAIILPLLFTQSQERRPTLGHGRFRTTFPNRPFSTSREFRRDRGGKTARSRNFALSEVGRRVYGSYGCFCLSFTH